MNEKKFKSYLESKNEPKKQYYNVVGGFDIETTQFKIMDDEDYSIGNYCYLWSFSLDGVIFTYGRDPEEFFQFLMNIKPEKKKIVIYVHWLLFEYWNLRWLFDKYFPYNEPKYRFDKDLMEIDTHDHYIFRCSSVLTNSEMSLEDMGKELGIEKLELDYSVPRNRNTWLTTEDIAYSLRDVEILCKWILSIMKAFNFRVNEIKKTPTSIYKTILNRHGLSKFEKQYNAQQAYRYWTEDDFPKFHKAFKNGIIVINDEYTNEIVKDVLYGDIASAYPYIMCNYRLPIRFLKGYGRLVKRQKKLIDDINNWAVLAKFTFKNIRLKDDAPCKIIDKIRKDKIYSAYMTNIEYKIIEMYYDYDSVEWEDFQASELGFLDRKEIETIHDLFEIKEKSRGTPGYGLKKIVLNCGFGEKSLNHEKLDTPQESRSSYYPQGVWIAAWQRYIMAKLVWEIGIDDFIYSNADSIFCKNNERTRKILEDYNMMIPYEKLGKFRLNHLKEFYILQPSRYVMTYDDGTTETRCSGVKRSCKVTLEDFMNVAEGDCVIIKEGHNINVKSDEIKLYTGFINGELVSTFSFLTKIPVDVELTKNKSMYKRPRLSKREENNIVSLFGEEDANELFNGLFK